MINENQKPEATNPDAQSGLSSASLLGHWQRESMLRTSALNLLCVLSPTDWHYVFGHPKYGNKSRQIMDAMEWLHKSLAAYETKSPNIPS